ncbi:STAS domain-containing protein [Metabacillus halosaccharovorans]|uniref:STAS domain-containing protein n=1 Tax=Metabacillus halosaccharovorans TaxID=930124 RepID=A0ABT3DLU9_9BACI|nr:STAS domain-containing protein [Metabacillus halosaccharovorans]MCV9888004.1 STAS domain-containing protein [Metabacillus halosaccharovorans]
MNLVFNVSNHLIDNAESLAEEIVDGVLNRLKLEIPLWEKEQALEMYIDFINFLGDSLFVDEEKVPESLIEWSKNNAARQVSPKGKISEIMVRYPPTREIITDIMTKISLNFGLSLEDFAFILKRINNMLDISLNETVFAFERLSDNYKKKTQRELAELSAPIVLIKKGVAVLPLIGIIDSYRANHIMKKVVPKVAELQINYVIADFSGILIIDTDIMRHLHQIGQMLNLLGIQTLTTGLRPELAKTVVNSGIEMSEITTFANVKQALDSIHQY